jgi:hypothetical protein
MLSLTAVRRFIFKETEMVVVDIGYRKMVMTKEQAMMLIECLEHAEVYETKYWGEEKRKELGMTETYTYHVYPNDNNFGMSIISEAHYQMAKLAGKPQEK